MLSMDVLKYIWSHPGNRGRRLRAVGRSVGWQLEKRVTGRSRDIRVFGDLWFRCYPDSRGAGLVIYTNGWNDFDEMHFVHRYLRPGDSVVDIGANVGVYTLLAASLVGEQGRVVSFEPGYESYRRLEENIRLNDLHYVELHPAAVGETSGMVPFYQDRDLVNRIAVGDELAAQPECVELVPCLTMDEALAGSRFHFGKIDIEGAELKAFRGGRRMLEEGNPPVWLVELKERLLVRYGDSARELARVLRSAGFYLGVYDAARRRLSFPNEPWRKHENVLAIHRAALDRVESRLAAAATTPAFEWKYGSRMPLRTHARAQDPAEKPAR